MTFDRHKFIGRFVEETRDHIVQLSHGFLALEKDSRNRDIIDSVYRSAHSIKGASRMMKFNAITTVAHRLEDVLDAIKKNELVLVKGHFDLFFETLDSIHAMVDVVSLENEIPEGMWMPICEKLEKAASGEGRSSGDASLESGSCDVKASDAGAEGTRRSVEPARESKPRSADGTAGAVRIGADKLDELINLMGEIVSSHNRLKERTANIRSLEFLAAKMVRQVEHHEESADEQTLEMFRHLQTLRVGLKHLLMDMRDDVNVHQHLSEDLQDRSIRMRMIPLSVKFESLHRIVRDLARHSSKEIDIEFSGGETELDSKIIDKIGDPLIHMIRNAIDHGIEPPQERLNKGKPANGMIRVSAGYDGRTILIDVSDDGTGIPIDKIKEKAIRKKMFSQAEMEKMSRLDIIQLIFQPGFSTTDLITDISGRGVGMDVVRRNINDDLKGEIHIETRENEGTAFHIRLPLTMAIIRIMKVRANDLLFAIPCRFIREVVRVSPKEMIDVVQKKAIMVREQIIPILSLADCMGLPGKSAASPREHLPGLILSTGKDALCVMVDEIVNEEDSIIKTLPPHMHQNRWVSGVFITGKNSIVNVLHVPRLFDAAKAAVIPPRPAGRKTDEKHIRILVVDDSVSTREIEKSILESYGYRVSLAADGVEALESARRQKYDLVITDIEMPRLDGFSLTKRLRQDADYRDTPIILVSSRDTDSDKRRGLESGANAYIIKGAFDQSNLLDVIENLVG